MIEAVLFDFDGTLIDSHKPLFLAYSQFMHILGKQATHAEFMMMNGFTCQEMVASVKSWYEIETPFIELLAFYKSLVAKHYQKASLFPGAKECINVCQTHGLVLGMVTSSLKEWVEPFLEKVGLLSAFSLLVTPDSVEKGKPSPEGYLYAKKSLQLSPKTTFVIEDAKLGVEAAQQAGFSVIQFQGDSPACQPYNEVVFLGDWQEITAFLQSQLDVSSKKTY